MSEKNEVASVVTSVASSELHTTAKLKKGVEDELECADPQVERARAILEDEDNIGQ